MFTGELVSKSRTITTAGVNSTTVRKDYLQSQFWTPAKVKGTMITLPGGAKFRKATSRLRINRKVIATGIEISHGTRNGAPCSIIGSLGGYSSDIVLKSNMPNIGSAIKSVSKFSGSPTGIPSEMRSEAATKALLEISSQKANIGETLATFRQTLEMFQRPGWRLVTALRAALKDQRVRRFRHMSAYDLRHGQNINEGLAALYLQYVYGLKPLMSDVYGVIELLKGEGSKSHLLAGDGYSRQQCEIAAGNYSGSGVEIRSVTGSESAKVHCKIWGRIDPNCTGLRSLNQLGLINPLSLAWDLIPLSFVLDWFVPVGSTLQALTAPAGLIFVDGTISNRFSLSCDFEETTSLSGYSAKTVQPATCTATYEGYIRQVLTSWPLPGVWVSSDPFVADRPLKALALAIANLRRI